MDDDLRQTIARTIISSPTVENANIWKKESNDKGKGNVNANSGTKGLKALDIPEGISTEELIVIQRCIHYFELTLEDGLDSEEETRIKYEKAKQDLQKVKQKFGRTEDYFSENVLRANYVIRNLKSPKYCR